MTDDEQAQVERFRNLVETVARLEDERRRLGFELHDEVVQGLAVARLAFDVDDRERLDHSLTQTLAAARRLVEELLGPDAIDAGDLRQHLPEAPG
jgi:signal transduction histidine kinase